MKVKVTVKTPKGRSVWCMKMMKSSSFIGSLYSLVKDPISEEVISDTEFFYIVNCKDKDFKSLSNKGASIDVSTKLIFRKTIEMIDKANSIATKSANGLTTAKNWIMLQFKLFKNPVEQEKVRNMDEQKFKEYLIINDRADIKVFLKEKDLVKFEIVTEPLVAI